MIIADLLYPATIVCVLFLIIFGVGLGFSYWLLIIIDKRARQCPACGAKGTGYIEETTVLEKNTHIDHKGMNPMQVVVETYEDIYECEQCHHRWTKTITETKRTPWKP